MTGALSLALSILEDKLPPLCMFHLPSDTHPDTVQISIRKKTRNSQIPVQVCIGYKIAWKVPINLLDI